MVVKVVNIRDIFVHENDRPGNDLRTKVNTDKTMCRTKLLSLVYDKQ
jgi:hypothetical protein